MNWKAVMVGLPYGPNNGMGVIRIMLGLLLIYHGLEVFNTSLMDEYATWDSFKGTYGVFLVYAGKSFELIAGISMFLGLFTRLGSILIIITFLYITFYLGNGRFWYEEQHPFMFVLFGLVYFFYGPGSWSLDKKFFGSKNVTGG
jgi:putative oxidoreductase